MKKDQESIIEQIEGEHQNKIEELNEKIEELKLYNKNLEIINDDNTTKLAKSDFVVRVVNQYPKEKEMWKRQEEQYDETIKNLRAENKKLHEEKIELNKKIKDNEILIKKNENLILENKKLEIGLKTTKEQLEKEQLLKINKNNKNLKLEIKKTNFYIDGNNKSKEETKDVNIEALKNVEENKKIIEEENNKITIEPNKELEYLNQISKLLEENDKLKNENKLIKNKNESIIKTNNELNTLFMLSCNDVERLKKTLNNDIENKFNKIYEGKIKKEIDQFQNLFNLNSHNNNVNYKKP